MLGDEALQFTRERLCLAPIPAILANALLIPYVILKVSEVPITFADYFPLVLEVGFGELICAGVFGVVLAFALRAHNKKIFKDE